MESLRQKKVDGIRRFLDYIWKKYDTDESGFIEADETKQMLEDVTGQNETMSKQDVATFLKSVTSSESITKSELYDFICGGIKMSKPLRLEYRRRSKMHQLIVEFFDGIDRQRIAFDNDGKHQEIDGMAKKSVEQKTTHSGEGGVAKEKEDGNGNEKPSLEPVTSSKFQVGAIVRVTSFNWNGIYVGHIGRVNDGAATYQVSFEDNTVDEAVEEENILEYVEKWEVGDKVVVILPEWDDNFIGEITESNNAIDYKKQRYTIYFDNDDTIEHDVTYHCIISKIS